MSKINSSLNELFKQLKKNEIRTKKWIDEYGNVKNIISTVHNKFRIVAAGSKLFSISRDDTFHDFLVEYLHQLITKTWFDSERKKDSKHPLITWSDSIRSMKATVDKGNHQFFSFYPTNIISAFMNLAYDLFIIDHNHRLQHDIIKRLKILEQFHGARYELFVTAICIKAGLKIDYENEKDRRRKRVEFIAFSDSSAENIAIEAKYKMREGLIGFDKIKIGNITRLINDATTKNPGLPQLIFLELNLPPKQSQVILSGKDNFQTMIRQTKQIKKDIDGKDFFNGIFFTNHAPFYGNDNDPVSNMDFILMISQNPKYQLLNQTEIIDKINKAFLNYHKIPTHFPAES